MAGARPSSFKVGGGFLNNVDGIISDYTFTSDFNGGDGGKRKKGKSDFTPLYCYLTVDVDGADEPATTNIFVGSADDFEIEDDGKTLVPVDDNGGLRQNSDFSFFIGSLCSAGFPESNLPEDRINFEAIIGTRARFVQEKDAELTARLGKKKSKDGKKEYDRTRLKVSNVLGLAAVKSNSKSKAGKLADDEDEVNELATSSLIALLKKAPEHTILKKKLPVQIINQVGAKHPLRNEVKDLVTSEEFLSAGEKWSYDEDTQKIVLD